MHPSTPMASAKSVRIMALGDSVTAMYQAQNYREWLGEKCRAAGFYANFVGAAGYDTLRTMTSRHSAIWAVTAQTVDTIYIDNWMDQANPDVVLMMLGANDIQGAGRSPEETIASLSSIITKMREHNPSVRVFLGMYPPIRPDLPDMARMIAMLPELAAELNTDASPVTAVDHAPGFDIRVGADHTDLTHPNTNGDRKYANNWFAAMVQEGLCNATPVLVNAAANKPVNADPVEPTDAITLLSNVVNGNIQDNQYWSRITTEDVTLTVDLQGEFLVSYIQLSHCSSWTGISYDVDEPHPWNTKAYELQLSNDQSSWNTVGSETDNVRGRTVHTFPPTSARYCRVILRASNDDVPLILREIRVMGVPVSAP